MSETRAVPLEDLHEPGVGGGEPQPPCPACSHGRLHPFKVTFGLGVHGFHGARSLEG